MSVEQELLSLLRQQHKSHMALMRAVLALSLTVDYLAINAGLNVPATEEDKKRWQANRAEFQKHLQDALNALAEPLS